MTDEARRGRLLSIETGFSCNSRCSYCTQLDYRVIPQADKLDLSTEEIRKRIAFAAEQGYDEVGFSGGEPTIRPDFIELVRFARAHAFKRVGVTTNGRMFAYRGFTEEAMLAGLDGFTFSLHGHTPDLHDGIAKADGALAQALAGLRNIAWVEKKHGLRAHMMSNTILVPDNIAHLADIVRLMGQHGIRLHMIQPVIHQRSNADEIERWFVPLDDVVRAVADAEQACREHGGRIKPYNVPNCLLWPFGDLVEPQLTDIGVFREFERERAGELRTFKARQWYRIEACRTCKEYCPGFRIEQFPQDRLLDRVREAIGAHAGHGRSEALVAATELLDAAHLRALFAHLGELRRTGALRRTAWMSGAAERTPREVMADAICEAGEAGDLDEVILLAQPMDERFLAQRVLERGNLEKVRQLLWHLVERRKRGRALPALRLFLNVGDTESLLDDPALGGHVVSLAKAFVAARADRSPAPVSLAIPNFPDDESGPDVDRQREIIAANARRIAAALDALGLAPSLVTLGEARGLRPDQAARMAKAEALFAAAMPVEDWSARWVPHELATHEMDFLSWHPFWLFARK